MAKTRPPDQLSLFAPTTDDVQRHTYKSDDEKQFERQRRFRSRRAKPDTSMPESGPCCGRCRHWWPPMAPADDVYGRCRVRVVTTDRHPALGDAGVGLLRTDDGALMISPMRRLAGFVAVQGMRTLPGFDCTSYEAAHKEQAA